MNELELMRLSRPDPAPSPDTVAKHLQELTQAIEAAAAQGSQHLEASEDRDGHSRAERPSEPGLPAKVSNRWTRMVTAAVVLVLAGLTAGVLGRGEDKPTRVLTEPPDSRGATTTKAATGVVPCGSSWPAPIPEGPYVHDRSELLPETVRVRIYACRTERPATVTRSDGQSPQLSTTLRELIERFGGLEGGVTDEFGKTHPISLAPLADADPDTTVVGLIWSGRPRNAPSPPTNLPSAPPISQTLEPPWVNPRP